MKAAIAILLVFAASLTGCGGGSDRTLTAKVMEEEREGIPADAGQWMVEIETDPDGELAYTVDEVVTPPGNTNFQLVNPQSKAHDLTVEEGGGGSAKTRRVSEGSAWRRVSLFDGRKYVFYCSVLGHRKAGMEGTIRLDPQLEADDLEAF